MVSSFVMVHLPFIFLPIYFIIYTITRVYKHWSDGKEPAHTSVRRFVLKLLLTFSLALLDIAHVADYSPNQHYTAEETAFRVGFYALSALAWLFSTALVFFDYIRRLKSQCWGQRMYWILEFFSYSVILILNTTVDHYDYSGKELYTFSLIQITCHALSVACCLVLSYYSIFKPDDFAPISSEVYFKLSHGAFTEDSIRNSENEISIKIGFTGYKSKAVDNKLVSYYKFNVNICGYSHEISKTLTDFEELNKAFKETKRVFEDSLPEFEYSSIAKLEVQDKGKALSRYLNELCFIDFMIPELVSFLNIKGENKEKINNLFGEKHEGKFRPDFNTRSQSIYIEYFSPKLENESSVFKNSTDLQWMVMLSLLRPEESLTKDVDFLVRFKPSKFSIEKTTGYKLQDFNNLHKTLSKVHSPAGLFYIDKKFPTRLRPKDEEIIPQIQFELEHYLLEVLNDPAFLCKEILDFIKCDVGVEDLLQLMENVQYEISDQGSWENFIGEDATHVTLYKIRIRESKGPREWQVLRRYREFDAFHKRLVSRHSSPLLRKYFSDSKIADFSLPSLPGKTLAPLSKSSEIENRKLGLVSYMQSLCQNPLVTSSYAFREFIDSIST